MNNTNDNVFYNNLSSAFRYIMFNDKFSKRGFRKFRVLFFCYCFGCIDSSTLFSIFSEYKDLDSKDLKISYANTLNYFFKQGYLYKEKSNYYTISHSGISILYNFINPDFHLDNELFYKNAKIIKLFCNHALVSGIAALTLAQITPCVIKAEVPLTDFYAVPDLKNKNLLYPDITINNLSTNENVFIEADCSTERKHSALIPKLQNYVNFLDINESNYNTILFSLWNRDTDYELSYKISFSLNYYISLFDFFKELTNSDLSVFDFLSKALEQGTCYSFTDFFIFSELATLISSNYINPDSIKLENIFYYLLIKKTFNERFFSRQKYLFETYRFLSNFKPFLLNGLRFISLPVTSNNLFYKLLVFDDIFNRKIIDFLLTKHNIYYTIKTHNSMHIFNSFSINISYVFRNVFEVDFNGHIHYFAIENISEDLGGYYRSKNYASKFSNYPISNLTLICVYNNFKTCDILDFVKFRYPHCDFIQFLSYEEIVLSLDFSDSSIH